MTAMSLCQSFAKRISTELRRRDVGERAQHVTLSAGRLSASALGWPLQWQILKALGHPGKDPDVYALAKFARGKDVERFILDVLKPPVTQQALDDGAIVGILDAYWPDERCPVEVKSVSNMKYKRVVRQGGPDRSHALQAAWYGQALHTDEFCVLYVASDDYRVMSYVGQTASFINDLRLIVATFQTQFALGTVPTFQPLEKWHSMEQYNPYPDFVHFPGGRVDVPGICRLGPFGEFRSGPAVTAV